MLRATEILKIMATSENYVYYVTTTYKKKNGDLEYYEDTHFKNGNKVTKEDYDFVYGGAKRLIKAYNEITINEFRNVCEWGKELYLHLDKYKDFSIVYDKVALLLDPNATDLRINVAKRKSLNMNSELFSIVNEFYEEMYGTEMNKKIALAS